MARKGTALAIGIAGLAGLALFLVAGAASADEGDGGPVDGPEDEGERGRGKGGSPKPLPGGQTWGEPDEDAGHYTVPRDWDPARGLWISPDCEMVVEAPGWFCGTGGPDGLTPQPFGGPSCTVYTAESYVDAMAMEGNGVAGYVDFLIELGMGPEEICGQILAEVSPLCADLPGSQWSPGLANWYAGFLERVTLWWEEWHGIEFDPEAA